MRPIGRASLRTDHETTGGGDREFVQRLRAGDPDAFDAVIKQHWRPLILFLARRVKSVDAATDLAQQAIVRLWHRRATLDANASVVTYLYQIARNLSIDEYRKSVVRHRWFRDQPYRDEVPESTALEVLAGQEVLARIDAAIETLPERRREAFVLVHLQNLTHRQAAAVMGTAPQTIANHVAAALADLRRALKPHLEDLVG